MSRERPEPYYNKRKEQPIKETKSTNKQNNQSESNLEKGKPALSLKRKGSMKVGEAGHH